MTNETIDRLLSAPIPGGSQARDWFLPHDTERGLENVRDVVRRLVAAEREACLAAVRGVMVTDRGLNTWKRCVAALEKRSNA